MKTFFPEHKQQQSGVAVIVVLAIISLLLVIVAANLHALNDLGGELRMVEKRQMRRIELVTTTAPFQISPTTNNISTSAEQPSGTPASK